MRVNHRLTPETLQTPLEDFFALAGRKILKLNRFWNPADGSPVLTRKGKYKSRGWTEWTQGFQVGCQLLQFDATGDERFLELGRENTIRHMAPHVSHTGVHDHGFNNISTYGKLAVLTAAVVIGDPMLMERFGQRLEDSPRVAREPQDDVVPNPIQPGDSTLQR